MAVAGLLAHQCIWPSLSFGPAGNVRTCAFDHGPQFTPNLLPHGKSMCGCFRISAKPNKFSAEFGAIVQTLRGNHPINRLKWRRPAARQQNVGRMPPEPQKRLARPRQRRVRRAQLQQQWWQGAIRRRNVGKIGNRLDKHTEAVFETETPGQLKKLTQRLFGQRRSGRGLPRLP